MSLRIFGPRLMWRLPMLASAALFIPLSAAAGANQPEPPPPPPIVQDNEAVVDGGASEGRIAVNVAAGNNNQQANVAAVAEGGTALTGGSVAQHLEAAGPPVATTGTDTASIAENAFAGSSGLIAVNVIAGSENQQANMALIAIGIDGVAVTDATLSQTRASQAPTLNDDDNTEPVRTTSIGAGAFADASGIVQVNLVGGERNSSANVFSLSVAAGVK